MYTSINGIYENGQLILLEEPPTNKNSKVIITFISEDETTKLTKRRLGGLEGKISIPDDFNDPLEDLEEYMS